MTILSVVAHFLQPDYINQAILLALRRLEGTHSGENQAELILDTLRTYNIEKIRYFVCDNATLNDTALQAILRSSPFQNLLRVCRHCKLFRDPQLWHYGLLVTISGKAPEAPSSNQISQNKCLTGWIFAERKYGVFIIRGCKSSTKEATFHVIAISLAPQLRVTLP